MQDVIKKNLSSHLEIINKILETNVSLIELFGNLLSSCLEKNGTIFLCGNGGSASDSQHIAAELVGKFKKERRALKSIALTTDSSILTSVGNDYGFKEIFSRQLEALATSGDIVIGISTSGNSEHIIRAFEVAKNMGVTTLSLTGRDGGKLKDFSDHCLTVPSESTARIQEAHILIGHILCDLIEKRLQLV